MLQFTAGAVVMCYWAVGLFFLRFWRKTHDRLFAIFSISFWLLGSIQLALRLISFEDETRTTFYTVRLFAFLLIVVAIVDKNRAQKTKP